MYSCIYNIKQIHQKLTFVKFKWWGYGVVIVLFFQLACIFEALHSKKLTANEEKVFCSFFKAKSLLTFLLKMESEKRNVTGLR